LDAVESRGAAVAVLQAAADAAGDGEGGAVGGDHADAAVVLLADVDVAGGVAGQADGAGIFGGAGGPEGAVGGAGHAVAGAGEGGAVGLHQADAVVVVVGHEDV